VGLWIHTPFQGRDFRPALGWNIRRQTHRRAERRGPLADFRPWRRSPDPVRRLGPDGECCQLFNIPHPTRRQNLGGSSIRIHYRPAHTGECHPRRGLENSEWVLERLFWLKTSEFFQLTVSFVHLRR
jgi:hypothetical protein